MTQDYQKRGRGLTRRLLIVDDQQQIHDTFSRVFDCPVDDDQALSQFEAKFLNLESREPLASEGGFGAAPKYELVHAMSCAEAVAKMKDAYESRNRFAVAFVDMRMPPGGDGIETTERLWAIDESLQVVICTAHSDHEWKDVLSRLGYSDRLLLLKKPFESDEIRQLALALTEKSRLAVGRTRQIRELKNEVSLRRQVEQELREMAIRDSLTQLPNRSFLQQRLEKVISCRKSDSNRHDAILFLDLPGLVAYKRLGASFGRR